MPALTVEQEYLRSLIDRLAQKEARAAQGLARARAMCAPHVFDTSGGDYRCLVCRVEAPGWPCATRPTGMCEYEGNPDECIHCGLPEERK